MLNYLIFGFKEMFLLRFYDDFGSLQATYHNRRGLKFQNQNRLEKAKIEFKLASKKETKSAKLKSMYLRNVSIAYHELNEIESCFYYLKEAIKFCKKDSYEYFITLGNLKVHEGNLKNAISILEKANAIEPDDIESNNMLGLIYLGDYGEELLDLEKSLFYNRKAHESENSNTTLNVLGRNYYALGEFEEAEKLFTEVVLKVPKSIDSLFSLGIIKYHLGKMQEARKVLLEVLSAAPELIEEIDEIIVEKLELDTELN